MHLAASRISLTEKLILRYFLILKLERFREAKAGVQRIIWDIARVVWTEKCIPETVVDTN